MKGNQDFKTSQTLAFQKPSVFFRHHDKKIYPLYQIKNSLEAKIV